MTTYGSTSPQADAAPKASIPKNNNKNNKKNNNDSEVFVDAKLWLTIGAAFLTGWINAVFFVRYKAFATMQAGNLPMLTFTTALRIQAEDEVSEVDPDSKWLFYLPPPSLFLALISITPLGACIHRMLVNQR
ncbi:unnamed protein product [Polarella glacialis]|uniref:Uncharacterized protein n=1 Tax=Polarella glacialis TaxID=89957 RepID=A0A813CYS3_POLGL|nr:unnamed protein product [Polarella glacialis]